MPYSKLTDYINVIEQQGELLRVKEFIDPVLQIAEITDRFSKQKDGGKALLFENTGTNFPVLINAFGSEKRMCLALGVKSLDEPAAEIDKLFKIITSPRSGFFDKLKLLPFLNRIASWMPSVKNGRGECQEIIIRNPDLSIFPVLQCWPYDGGRFITLPMVITKDPLTGIRNTGMYRMQVIDQKTTGMHWHKHKTGARHFEEYKKIGKKMPVSVALGGDPVYTYSATAPLPDNIDEFLLAGFLRKKKVSLVKCITNDLEVPADADIVIEGFVDPGEDLFWEGPFGDHTGFYSLADWYPKFHVTCITHRKNAVYPATVVGIPPMEDAWIGKTTERIFLEPIKKTMLPEVHDLDLPFAGVAHNIAIVSIDKTFPGQAQKVMNSLWGAGQMMFNKILIVTDKNVDIHNYKELLRCLFDNIEISSDVYFAKGTLDVLDHAASNFAFGGKMFLDATRKFSAERTLENQFKKSPSLEEVKQVLSGFSDIKNINFSLIKEGFPVIIASVIKTKKNSIRSIANEMCSYTIALPFCVIFVDYGVPIENLFIVTWVASGNIDPARDCFILQNSQSKIFVIDATIKTNLADNYTRLWPNILCMDKAIVETIDNKWKDLNIGKFIPSPSSEFDSFPKSEGAVFEEDK